MINIDYKIKNELMNKYIEEYKEKAEIFQSNFKFTIPDYVLDEMITAPYNTNNIISLINMSKMYNRITEINAKILIEFIKLNDLQKVLEKQKC